MVGEHEGPWQSARRLRGAEVWREGRPLAPGFFTASWPEGERLRDRLNALESDAAALRDRVQALEQQVMQQTCAHYWERTGWVSHVKRDWSSTQVGNRPYPVEVMECAKCEALTFEPFERGPYGGKPSYADLEGRVQALETALEVSFFAQLYELDAWTDEQFLDTAGKWSRFKAEWGESEHYGDCTKAPCPCMRCHVEMVQDAAREATAALLSPAQKEGD